MKGFGICFIVLAVLNFIVAIIAAAEYPEVFVPKLMAAMMMGIIGWLLIEKANKNKQHQEEKEKWNNNEK